MFPSKTEYLHTSAVFMFLSDDLALLAHKIQNVWQGSKRLISLFSEGIGMNMSYLLVLFGIKNTWQERL